MSCLNGKDPLHIPSADLVVWHKGKEALVLNKRLLDRQNCWRHLDKILELHSERLHLEDMMKGALVFLADLKNFNHTETLIKDTEGFLMLCNEYYTLLEYELQEAWGFPIDSNFHRFWTRPGCGCPRMDNEDAYPYGFYIKTDNCPLHGYSVPLEIPKFKPKGLLDLLGGFFR